MTTETLGRVTCPGGVLLLVDAGCLDVWLREGVTTEKSGQVDFGGLSAVVITGLPKGPFSVVGERIEDRWKWVALEVSGRESVRTEELGVVAVDAARLCFADANALKAWKHHEAMDGKADVVFWGRDDGEVAREMSAPDIPEGYGWIDLPVDEAEEKYARLSSMRSPDRRFAVDYRPHSHHCALMAQVRESETQSGTISVDGAEICGFMTSWGDGWFPVERDVDVDGNTVRIRVVLYTDESA